MSNKEYCKGTSLYALIFVIVFILLTVLLRRPKPRHLFGKQLEKLTYLLFMDTLKLYSSSDNDIDSFVGSVKILSENIGGKFCCGWICCAKNGKSKTSKMWRKWFRRGYDDRGSWPRRVQIPRNSESRWDVKNDHKRVFQTSNNCLEVKFEQRDYH